MTEAVQKLQALVDRSRRIVFFGGAGVSTESGIPDFRSTGGLYHQEWAYPPETILSHSFFMRNPAEFYRFCRAKLYVTGVKPNAAHYALAKLEERGRLTAVVTQNIDGLHQAAGSRNVLELHGSVYRNHCMKCGQSYPYEFMTACKDVPVCTTCGGIIKPDVVLYEESLDNRVITESVRNIAGADMLIIGGTSLVVYPAAGLVNYFNGDSLVIINKSPTGEDRRATLLITEPIGEVFAALKI
ncbi:MAG: NAD-dependent protein deacylase [Spirochaetaceae bacterium]|jgi:NAD-dependent deacetylase|nr:NAD-dependent protein deacylase [Spirochaetaceae bacterium]